MKRILFGGVALAAALAASGALAENGWYGAIDLGYHQPLDVKDQYDDKDGEGQTPVGDQSGLRKGSWMRQVTLMTMI